MANSYARGAMARIAGREKAGQTKFTATDTGARREALRRLTSGPPSLGKFVKQGTVKGAGAQFKEVTADDVEGMIKRSK